MCKKVQQPHFAGPHALTSPSSFLCTSEPQTPNARNAAACAALNATGFEAAVTRLRLRPFILGSPHVTKRFFWQDFDLGFYDTLY